MKLTLARYHDASDDTLGLLFIDERFVAHTLEDEKREVKVYGETRIPEGSYELGLTHSPKFTPIYGHDMIEILGVKGFSKVYFHPLNEEKQTDGCVGVGNVSRFNPAGNSRIEESKLAYLRIYPEISEAIKKGKVTIDVIDIRA